MNNQGVVDTSVILNVANLISQRDELLAACEAALDGFARLEGGTCHCGLCERLRRAIAKAKEETSNG